MDTGLGVFIGVLLSLIIILGAALFYVYFRLQRLKLPSADSSLAYMRSIGQLSVFKVLTKEIVTEIDHSWGEFGAKYLSWVLSGKKMAMIFEIEIDFKYDLRSSHFNILTAPGDKHVITMPPCFYDTHIRDIKFYDEQGSKFLPWLMPELLSGFLAGGFNEKDKNRLVDAAKQHAQQQAERLIDDIHVEFENSARSTLASISKAFGAQKLEFQFPPQRENVLDIKFAGKLIAGESE